jgi:two-component system chemotaxis response regulator CheB
MAIKVLVVDDSAAVRQAMRQILSAASDLVVLDTAIDPLFALEKMKRQWPDVIVLDVEMPRMDGLAFLQKLMVEHPTPVIICSSLTQKGTAMTLEALAAGAVAVFAKSDLDVTGNLQGQASELVRAVRAAALARPRARVAPVPMSAVTPKHSADVVLPQGPPPLTVTTERIVALGTSTGGTQALELVLTRLPRTCPALVIVQHMPAQFTSAFAARLNGLSEIEVREAKAGDRALPGRALIAPGGKHLVVVREGACYAVDVRSAPPVNRHCPSVDVLFRSVARAAGRNATGIIMTGMGDDGAKGLLELREAGAVTYAQDEKSCIVFGMPKEAIALGAAQHVVSLEDIPRAILRAGAGAGA